MSCGKCVKRVTSSLEALPGVDSVEVDLKGEQAVSAHPPRNPLGH